MWIHYQVSVYVNTEYIWCSYYSPQLFNAHSPGVQALPPPAGSVYSEAKQLPNTENEGKMHKFCNVFKYQIKKLRLGNLFPITTNIRL